MEFKEWTGVSAENTYDSIKAGVLGREIEFSKSVFPTSIKIEGEEILYAPISLTAMFSDIKGEWTNQNVVLTEKTDELVRYSVAQTAENLIVNADVTIEFDGFIRVDLRLIPFWSFHKDNMPRLTKLYIDIPIKKKYSTLMHFWPNCESGVCLSGKVLNSYETPMGDTDFAFKPYMWTGWEYGGLGICCESDKNFEIDNSEKCMSVSSNEEYTNIHIALLDNAPADWKRRRDEWGNNINPITYSFALQPTPVKKFNNNNLREWRAFHMGNIGGSRENAADGSIFEKVSGTGDTLLEKIAQKGVRWLILHEDWSAIQNYGLPYDEERFKQLARDCHELGMKLMVYFGYEVSSLYPGFNDVCDEYLNKNIHGNFVGGWQREPMQRDFTVCYKGGYSDVMIDRVKYVMDVLGVDGIYTDGTYVPWECANEAHGCGYRDKSGQLKYAYPIYAVREHVKKLYKAVHERGGVIDTYQSSCSMMATLGFADSYYDGENIQGMLQADISNMKMDSFRTEFMGLNMGIPCNFISYTDDKFTMEIISGITLLHNVYPRANKLSDLDFVSEIWGIYDNFAIDKAQWFPYWEKQEISVDNDKAYVSYYKKDNALLLIITSYDKNASEVKLTLDGEYNEARNMLAPEKTVSVDGKMLTVPVESTKISIIEVKR